MGEPTRRIKGLGEIALRVADLDAMQRFYQEVVGLEVMRRFDHAAFFRIADGYGGHTQVLALFDRSDQASYRGLAPERTTVDHLAFEIDKVDYEVEKARLEGLRGAGHDDRARLGALAIALRGRPRGQHLGVGLL
jgi:catechol 2,3-dioxygenase-like lactoylglutathione lyase family enzyme